MIWLSENGRLHANCYSILLEKILLQTTTNSGGLAFQQRQRVSFFRPTLKDAAKFKQEMTFSTKRISSKGITSNNQYGEEGKNHYTIRNTCILVSHKKN
jgi:hypothetical protein